MDFKKLEKIDNGVKIVGVKNFDPKHIFECGQCFRWNNDEEKNSYIGVAFEKVIEVRKKGEDVYIYNTSEKEFNDIWAEYFDLNTDYDEIKNKLKEDETLRKSIEFGSGIRLLRQDPFEMIISFIISSNNRIPMIKRAIKNISKKWGKCIEYKGNKYYTFPKLNDIKDATIEELQECGVGFRARYIKGTVIALCENNNIKNMLESDDDECYKKLQKFMGVGPKVADCIMLFGMNKFSAFPVDVWVKRAMQYFYVAPDVSLKKIREFAREKFGKLSGYAQQYLFYYARENNIIV